MDRITFDPKEKGSLEMARVIVLQRLKEDRNWRQFEHAGGFDKYVEYIGDEHEGRRRLRFLSLDVLWELMIQGVVAPGLDENNSGFPWFHLTEYGEEVIEKGRYVPHDPSGYLERFCEEPGNSDPVVRFYLTESLDCFHRGSLVASVVMLGIASEQMFILLCDALLESLSDPNEKDKFGKLLIGRNMKPKMDWVSKKIVDLHDDRSCPLPNDVVIMLTPIFDLIRNQRNDLGHPRVSPPDVTRDQAFAYLELFPIYCRVANQSIQVLKKQ